MSESFAAGEVEQRKQDATSWVKRSLKQERDWDKITHLLSLVEGASEEQGRSPSREQHCIVFEVREMVRTALLSLIAGAQAEDTR